MRSIIDDTVTSGAQRYVEMGGGTTQNKTKDNYSEEAISDLCEYHGKIMQGH